MRPVGVRGRSSTWGVSIELYPFRYRDPLTRKWVRARYLAERHEIAARYAEWEITGPPEIRADSSDGYFSPFRNERQPLATNVDQDPNPDSDGRRLVLLFLRRYVTYCARRRRYPQMEGAARLYKHLRVA
jgi:hypothetical protein